MENENFKSWGPEDQEKHYRFPKLGYNVGRFNSFVYHLEHSRGKDSETINPYFKDNMDLFSKLETFTEEELKTYYNNQTYLRNYS